MAGPLTPDEADKTLVTLCQAELPYVTTAFEKLVRKYEPLVYRTCLRYLKSPIEAEEASQDVFLRVFHNLKDFKGTATFKTWLFRVTANTCASRYRSLRRIQDRHRAYVELAELAASPVQSSTELDLGDGPIVQALETLSPTDRETLILRHVSELSLEEMADTLQLGLSATKMRLYRAERRLRAAVGSMRQEKK